MRVVVFASAETYGICRRFTQGKKQREDGWKVVLHSLMLGPGLGAKAMGDHTMGGVYRHGTREHNICISATIVVMPML